MELEKYAIKVSLVNEYGDEELFEIVPSVSYEQAAEALARIIKQYEQKLELQQRDEHNQSQSI